MITPKTRITRDDAARILATFEDVDWAPSPNTLVVHCGDIPLGPVTSVIVLVTDAENRVLLTHVAARGWDAPGGHLEAGESPREAALRELAEETGLILPTGVKLTHAATQVLRCEGPRPEGYTYPHPLSTQVIYRATLTTTGRPVAPAPDMECTAADWVPMDDAAALVGDRTWVSALTNS